jgi:hypothetical protein
MLSPVSQRGRIITLSRKYFERQNILIEATAQPSGVVSNRNSYNPKGDLGSDIQTLSAILEGLVITFQFGKLARQR